MKRVMLIIGILFVLTLSACQNDSTDNEVETSCDEGYSLQFGECIEDEVVCNEGFHVFEGECIPNTVECSEGLTEQNGECVLLDNRLEVPSDSSVYPSLVATSDVFDMFYFEEFTTTTMYITNVYSAYNATDELSGTLYKATGDGRWGPVTYLITLDLSGDILAFDVLESSENWGSFIELDSFQDQFDGMSITHYEDNSFELGVDGNASATTTIPLTENVLKEVAMLYQTEFN